MPAAFQISYENLNYFAASRFHEILRYSRSKDAVCCGKDPVFVDDDGSATVCSGHAGCVAQRRLVGKRPVSVPRHVRKGNVTIAPRFDAIVMLSHVLTKSCALGWKIDSKFLFICCSSWVLEKYILPVKKKHGPDNVIITSNRWRFACCTAHSWPANNKITDCLTDLEGKKCYKHRFPTWVVVIVLFNNVSVLESIPR